MYTLFSKLPSFKGKGRLFNLLALNEVKGLRNFDFKGKLDCVYHLPNALESVARGILINGIYEKEIHDILKQLIPKNGVFLDIGANIGAISIPLKKARPDISMVCIEAAPQVYYYLRKNIDSNGLHDIKAFNNAVYNEDDLTLQFFSPAEQFGKGSLSPVFTQEGVSVSTVKIDTLLGNLGINKVDTIKVDVEGYEYFVFSGAEQLLKAADAPDIIFEFGDWTEENAKGVEIGDAQRVLKSYGYKLYLVEKEISKVPLTQVLTKGSAMLFATKK